MSKVDEVNTSKYEIGLNGRLEVRGYTQLFETRQDAHHINEELTEDGMTEVVAEGDDIYRVCSGCGKTYSFSQLGELAENDRDVTKCRECNHDLIEPEDAEENEEDRDDIS